MAKRTSITFMATVCVTLLFLTGCDIESASDVLRKDSIYLFEMTNESAEKNNLPPAFKGVLLLSRGEGEREVLSIRLGRATRKIQRSAFSNITFLREVARDQPRRTQSGL